MWVRRIGAKLHYFLFIHDADYLTVIPSFIALFWGVWLLCWNDTFVYPSYRVMALLAPEHVWGAVAIGVGGTKLLVYLLDLSSRWHAALCLVTFLMWLLIAACLGIANISGTGTPVYSTMALMAFGAFFRAVMADVHQ